MGFYDFSKRHYLISAAIGEQTSRFTAISKKYPRNTFLKNYFRYMRRSIHQFSDQLYASGEKEAGKIIGMEKEEAQTYVKMAALYYTVALTARKENEKFLRNMNLSKTILFEELYRQLEFTPEERKLGKHFVHQAELDFPTFTANWCSVFASKIFHSESSEFSSEQRDRLRMLIHGSFLFYMKPFC